MDQLVGQAIAPWRFSASTLGILSGFALLLSIVAVYGLVSQFIVERKREIAIRSALGALPRDVVQLVVREGALLTTLGVAVGLAVAAAVTRVLESLLFGVRPLDPGTLIGTAALFMTVALAAMISPVKRALRIEPAVTLGGWRTNSC